MPLPLIALVGLGGVGAGTAAGFAMSKGVQSALILGAIFLMYKFSKA